MKREEIEARAREVCSNARLSSDVASVRMGDVHFLYSDASIEGFIGDALHSAYTAGLERAAEIAEGRELSELRSRDKAKSAGRDGVASHRDAGAEVALGIVTAIRAEKHQD